MISLISPALIIRWPLWRRRRPGPSREWPDRDVRGCRLSSRFQAGSHPFELPFEAAVDDVGAALGDETAQEALIHRLLQNDLVAAQCPLQPGDQHRPLVAGQGHGGA